MANTITFTAGQIYLNDGHGIYYGGGDGKTGAWSFTLPVDSYILAGLDGNTNTPLPDTFAGLIFDNPSPNNTRAAAITTTWNTTINGGVTSFNGTGVVFSNYLTKTTNTLTVSQDGHVSGTQDGVFIQAATNITNSGNITGGNAVNIDGFFDGEINVGANVDNTSDYMNTNKWIPDSNVINVSKITIANKGTGEIIGQGDHATGINSHSYATIVVTNDGLISGGYTTGYGDWAGQAINAYGTLTLNNSATGLITGDVHSGWVGTTITNSGEIDGTIQAFVSDTITVDARSGGGHIQNFANAIIFKPGDATNTQYLDTNHNQVWDSTDALLSKAPNVYTNTGVINGVSSYGYDDNNTPNDTSDDLYFRVAFDLGPQVDQVKNTTGKIIGDMWLGSGNDTLTNGGKIYGNVDMGNGDDVVINTGSILVLDNPQSGTSADTHHGGVNLGSGANTLTNSGTIQRGVLGLDGYDKITNNAGGFIYGGINIGLGGGLITNSGVVYDSILTLSLSSADITTISNTATGSIFNGINLNSGTNSVTNLGKVYGGISLNFGNNTISNSGILDGGIYEAGGYTSTGYNTITNTKFINGDVHTGDAGIGRVDAKNAPVQEQITNSGTIAGSVSTGGGNRLITNSGTIAGNVEVGNSGSAGKQTISNTASGIIGGNVLFDNSSAGSLVAPNLNNAGQISGEVYIASSANGIVITNAATGHIGGSVNASDTGGTFTNLGFLSGHFSGSTGKDTVINSKDIGGDVSTHAGSGDSVTNNKTGHIHGDVALADYAFIPYYATANSTDGTLTNSGFIDGSVFGGVHNTITNTGTISGQVYVDINSTVDDSAAGASMGDVYFNGATIVVDSVGTFLGGASAETVHYQGGTDNYTMGGGNDTVVVESIVKSGFSFSGGLGTDTLDFSHLSGVTILLDLSAGTVYANTNSAQYAGNISSFERVIGTSGGDHITGSAGNDYIDGNGGGDTITAGGGGDKLFAGTGSDTFVYTALNDSTALRLTGTNVTRDTINNFDDAHDKIQLASSIFGAATPTWLGENTAFGHNAGEFHTIQAGNQTILEVDTDGDGKANMSIAIDGIHHLTGDILIV